MFGNSLGIILSLHLLLIITVSSRKQELFKKEIIQADNFRIPKQLFLLPYNLASGPNVPQQPHWSQHYFQSTTVPAKPVRNQTQPKDYDNPSNDLVYERPYFQNRMVVYQLPWLEFHIPRNPMVFPHEIFV